MPEWLNNNTLQIETTLSPMQLAGRLILAFVMGCVAAGIYRFTHRPDTPRTQNFVPTLILLAILIAMVTLVIGDNVARAFGLVGALSIVRFRTVIQDTRDTAFVIFAVVLGMAIGAGFLNVALIGSVVVGVAALLLSFSSRGPATLPGEEYSLSLRVSAGLDADGLLETTLGQYLETCDLLSSATARQGAALDLKYQIRLQPGISQTTVMAELNRIEGIQNVEMRRL